MLFKCMIIGLGQIGMEYDLKIDPKKAVFTHARAFSEHSFFDLVAAVDANENQRKLFKKSYNLPVYSTIPEAIQKHDVDVVVIAVPTTTHYSILKETLKNLTPKLILCEKPLSYNLVEARMMVNTCKNAGVKLYVNYIRRADVGAIEIKSRIETNKIAEPIKGTVWYSKGIFNNGSHFFNLLEFWLGPFLRGKTINNGRIWNDNDPEPDFEVEFKKGKMYFISAWEEHYSYYTIDLISSTGRLRYENGGEKILWQSVENDRLIKTYKNLKHIPEIINNNMKFYQLNVVEQIKNILQNKQHTLSNGFESLETIKAMNKLIYQKV